MTEAKVIEVDPNEFEGAFRSDEMLSQDFREWPEAYRKLSDTAIAKLLEEHPGYIVAREASECIDETDARFPDGDEHKGKFFAIRRVRIDKPATNDRPLQHLSEVEHGIEKGKAVEVDLTAAERLRAFEDRILGEDVVRLDGHVERGHGSKFQRMTAEQKAAHAALVHLVGAEDRMTKAIAEHAAATRHLEKAREAAPHE